MRSECHFLCRRNTYFIGLRPQLFKSICLYKNDDILKKLHQRNLSETSHTCGVMLWHKNIKILEKLASAPFRSNINNSHGVWPKTEIHKKAQILTPELWSHHNFLFTISLKYGVYNLFQTFFYQNDQKNHHFFKQISYKKIIENVYIFFI